MFPTFAVCLVRTWSALSHVSFSYSVAAWSLSAAQYLWHTFSVQTYLYLLLYLVTSRSFSEEVTAKIFGFGLQYNTDTSTATVFFLIYANHVQMCELIFVAFEAKFREGKFPYHEIFSLLSCQLLWKKPCISCTLPNSMLKIYFPSSTKRRRKHTRT